MLKVIDDEKLIRKYAKLFARSFKPFTDETIRVKLGHQGASFPAKISWSKKLGGWSFSQSVAGVRYANSFGTEKPLEGNSLPITTEINFPWSGIDRKTGAAFARDAWDNIYVIHRGKIGGGKKGIGKSLFEENYRGLWTWMEDGDAPALVAVIGALRNPRFALQATQFVRKIGLLKSAVSSSQQTSLNFPDLSFREELIGATAAAPAGDSLSEACDHDIIISHLASLLRRWKFKVGNDADHELFLMHPENNRISHVFAVSADSTSRSILAASADLLLRKSAGRELMTAVLVIQEDQLIQYIQPLQRIGITAWACRLEAERIIFPDLGKIRLDQNSQL
jgi:hypothetical protein